MKNFYLLSILFLCTLSMFAQTPQKMNYQTVVRNSSDMILANQSVGIQISILQGSALGTAVYIETQTPTTNANGLASIEIGTGSVVSGVFSIIDWANNTYFIKTEIDIAGGTSYTITGTSQLASVPYALHAKTAESVSGTVNYTETDPVYSASPAKNITTADITTLSNTSGTNTGDQDITGIATNTTNIATNVSDISTLQTEQTTQNTAIALNTAKTGITTQQASDITANTAKISVPTGGVTGDIMYNNGTNWVRLPKGTAGQALAINAGETAPEWVTISTNANIIQVSLAGTLSPTNAIPVDFTEILFSKGSDFVLNADGTISGLKAGRTYKITAHISGRGAATTGVAIYYVYDYTSNAIVGERMDFIANSYVYTFSQKPSGISYITPTVDTTVGLRAASAGSNYNIGTYTTFTVEEVR
jgi:hypothetical protein